MAVKGNLNLEIDEQGVEVRISLTPDENGGDLTVEGIRTLLAEKNIRQGVDLDAIDRAMRSLARGRSEPVTFVAANGVRPEPPSPETIAFEPLSIPDRLAATARTVVTRARPAQGYRLREERTRQ